MNFFSIGDLSPYHPTGHLYVPVPLSALPLLSGMPSHYTPAITHGPVSFFHLLLSSLMTQPMTSLILSHHSDLYHSIHSLITIPYLSFTFHQNTALISFQYLYLTLYSLMPCFLFLTFLLHTHKASTPHSPAPSYPSIPSIHLYFMQSTPLLLRTCPSDNTPSSYQPSPPQSPFNLSITQNP